MEREFAIQSQITEAARRLASDPHVSSKKLKKQRKTSYLNALKKLRDIENAINEYRVRSGKKPTQRASLIIEGINHTHSHSCASTHIVISIRSSMIKPHFPQLPEMPHWDFSIFSVTSCRHLITHSCTLASFQSSL